MSTRFIHLSGLGEGGLYLSWIGFAEPHLEIICKEVGVDACIVGAKALDSCLRLYLRWYLIINLEEFNMSGQWLCGGGHGPLWYRVV